MLWNYLSKINWGKYILWVFKKLEIFAQWIFCSHPFFVFLFLRFGEVDKGWLLGGLTRSLLKVCTVGGYLMLHYGYPIMDGDGITLVSPIICTAIVIVWFITFFFVPIWTKMSPTSTSFPWRWTGLSLGAFSLGPWQEWLWWWHLA